jgi:hypothetical protein
MVRLSAAPAHMSETEIPLTGGSVTSVVRVGDTVRRAMGPWSPAVHALLKHLERSGFAGAPRVLGIDEQGREILTYIHGTSAMRPWPEALRSDPGILALGGLIAGFHSAVASFTPPSSAVWRNGSAALAAGQIIRHGDLGPWNSIWRDDSPVALIDWDFAEPGLALDDLAQAAWHALPLRGPELVAQAGFAQPPDLRRRLAALCAGYGGIAPARVVDALIELQEREFGRIRDRGASGEAPWAMFRSRGDGERIARESEWLRSARSELI